QRSLQALRFSQAGRLGICAEEKTGRPILPRRSPTPPVQPGKPAQREHEYSRHGVRAFLASFVVPPGPRVWNLGPTRTKADGAAPLTHVVPQLPARQRYAWGGDNLNTHASMDGCHLGAAGCDLPCVPEALERGVQRRAFLRDPTPQPVLHVPPKHGSWCKQVEWWLSVLARRFLKRGAYAAAQDVDTRLLA